MREVREILILGTGGNCVDILDTIGEINAARRGTQYACVGFLDDAEDQRGKVIHGVEVLGPLAAAARFPKAWFINGIGSPSTFWRKEAILAKASVPRERFATLVHPTACASKLAELGRGVVLLQHVTVGVRARVGDHVIILPNSVISHDASVGDYGCVAGGVCVSGGVTVGRSCYLGTNSSIRNDVRIGEGSLIGMGSVVLEDVPANSVVVGNPARILRRTVPGPAHGPDL